MASQLFSYFVCFLVSVFLASEASAQELHPDQGGEPKTSVSNSGSGSKASATEATKESNKGEATQRSDGAKGGDKQGSETKLENEAPPATEEGHGEKGEDKSEKKKSSQKRGYGKTSGVFGPVLIGPKLTLIALPVPFQAGLETKIFNWFGFSFDYGMIPSVGISGVNISASTYQFAARFYPFRGSFYLGAGWGQRKLTGKKDDTIQGYPVSVEVNVTSQLFTPQMGWRFVWNSGWFMGIELGWEVASGADTKITTNAPSAVTTDPTYLKNYDDVTKAGNQIGSAGLPHVTLLQFGYFF